MSLETLNQFRTELGMRPLKVWKASKQKLADDIASLQEIVERERQAGDKHFGTSDQPPVNTPAGEHPEPMFTEEAGADAAEANANKKPIKSVAEEQEDAKKAPKKNVKKDAAPRARKAAGKPSPDTSKKSEKPKNKAASGEDFAKFLAEKKLNPRVARAKLRRHKFKAPYVLDDKLKSVLLGDARKAKK